MIIQLLIDDFYFFFKFFYFFFQLVYLCHINLCIFDVFFFSITFPFLKLSIFLSIFTFIILFLRVFFSLPSFLYHTLWHVTSLHRSDCMQLLILLLYFITHTRSRLSNWFDLKALRVQWISYSFNFTLYMQLQILYVLINSIDFISYSIVLCLTWSHVF